MAMPFCTIIMGEKEKIHKQQEEKKQEEKEKEARRNKFEIIKEQIEIHTKEVI